ncbi:hypothetical protein BKA67DRAFT_580689 [Truncatella angustata]|uniref:Uncharacterized protein n=1 Tax=Truncatella angustata TaxID=152316 RepID=A0A9P8UCY4_9PEZI|nr:uncharacterized protein BKA67DRAFT_580689 [Truncatella angustata]KAH6646835.1 hypothetical protein BKA67DRAFT_580689 [Truncatella angustata]
MRSPDVMFKRLWLTALTLLMVVSTMIIQIRDTECPANSQFYVCSLNNFNGCCSTDPCSSVEGCPESSRSSSTSLALPSTTTLSAISTWIEPISTKTATTAPATSMPHSATATTPAASDTSPEPPATSLLSLIIAVGALAILVLALLGWIFRKRLIQLIHFRQRTKTAKTQGPFSIGVFEMEGAVIRQPKVGVTVLKEELP